jgi:hypothetical protein
MQRRDLRAVQVKIHYRVQAVERRTKTLDRLLPLLPSAVDVIVDREPGRPNPYRNFLRCLGDPPSGVTHLAVIQDDALPCANFEHRLTPFVEEKPDDLISLFVGGLPGRTRREFFEKLGSGEHWSHVYFREIHHVVATVWPVQLAENFSAWVKMNRLPGANPPRSDDAIVGYWCRKTRRSVWATVPCLVEHPDDFPSTVQMKNRFGDKGRRAIAFIDAMQ